MREFFIVLGLVVVGMLTAGCSRAGGQATLAVEESQAGEYWPTEEWRTSTPEAQGMDGEVLAQMAADVRDKGLDFHSLLVIRHGYIVHEAYFGSYNENRKHEVFSVAKSFTATLVGIALDQNRIGSVDQEVLEFFPKASFENLDDGKRAMTLKDILTMTSGLEWQDTNENFGALYASQDWAKNMLDRKMSRAPGEAWSYCSGCSHLLATVIDQTSGTGALEFAEKNLFEPLGIREYTWDTDGQGIPIGGWSLQMMARDMAKLGYLYLHEGRWDGKQVVSAEWVREATTARYDTDSPFGLRYGYHWWTYPRYGAYAALGREGQTVFVIPDLGIVFVTTAGLSGHEQVYRLVDEYVVPAAK